MIYVLVNFEMCSTCCNEFAFCLRLWQHVTSAINAKDQNKATQEKFILEEAQRQEARQRGDRPWNPHLFTLNPITNEWNYKYMEYAPTRPFSAQKATALKTKKKKPLYHLFCIMLCVSVLPPSPKPWDPDCCLVQFEKDGIVQTKEKPRRQHNGFTYSQNWSSQQKVRWAF